MSSIVEGLMKQLTSGDTLSFIGKKVGADNKSVKSTLEMGLPLLLGAMNNSASKPEGLNAIMKGLSQAGNTDPMKNITGFLGASDSVPGSDMLGSILGSNVQPIQQAISKSSGLSSGVVGKILAMVMPLLMGSLSKNLGKNMVPGDLSKLLGEQSKMALSASPNAAGAMQDLFASEKSSGGLLERIKKFFNP
jgi:hypothetical protein